MLTHNYKWTVNYYFYKLDVSYFIYKQHYSVICITPQPKALFFIRYFLHYGANILVIVFEIAGI